MKRTLVIFTAALLIVLSLFCASAERVTQVFNVPITQSIGTPNVEDIVDKEMGVTHVIPDGSGDGSQNGGSSNSGGTNSGSSSSSDSSGGASDETQASTDATTEKKKGCGSAIGISALAVVMIPTVVCFSRKKKEN